MIRMCERCSRDESEIDFQEDSKSILCVNCFYELFHNLIPGLKVPIDYKVKVADYKPMVLFEGDEWKEKKKELIYMLDGKWARRFIHLL